MNTQIQLEHQTQSLYRLRNKRQRRRALITGRDKGLIAISGERNTLYQQQRDQPWIDLKPPVMRGWKRYFVLRDDVARSKDAAMFESILSKINTVQYSQRRDFKKKKRKGGKKVYNPREQHLERLHPWQWHKAAFSQKEAAFFEPCVVQPERRGGPTSLVYVFSDKWRYVLRIRPNMITKVREPDAELESRLSLLNNHLKRNNLEGRMNRLVYGGAWRYCDHPDRSEYSGRNKFKNIPLRQLLA